MTHPNTDTEDCVDFAANSMAATHERTDLDELHDRLAAVLRRVEQLEWEVAELSMRVRG